MKLMSFIRKTFVTSLVLLISGTCGCQNSNKTDKVSFRNSTSVSPFSELMFRSGYTFEDQEGNSASNAEELQKLFVVHGANEIFVRIATARKPYSMDGADHSLAAAVEKAKMAKNLDLPLNPEIGLFKYYGDVTGQPGPDFSEYPEITMSKLWIRMDIDEMTDVLEQYGKIVAEEILATGVEVNVWDIGNEVNFGIAGVSVQPLPNAMAGEMGEDWYEAPDNIDPDIGKESVYSLLVMENNEKIGWLDKHVWPNQAKLMKAVCSGILSADPDARFSTHITFPENTEFVVAFYRAMKKYGLQLDVAGLSYYPSSSPLASSISQFKNTVDQLVRETQLPVFIAEYAYPAYTEDHIPIGPYKDWNNKVSGYEMNYEGQAALLRDLTCWGKDNGICGIRPWAPDLVSLYWTEFSVFSVSGLSAKALPVLDAISEGLKCEYKASQSESQGG